MAPLIVICVSIALLSLSYATDMCFWGRNNYYDRAANGLYREGPESVNGKTYWKLDRSNKSCSYEYYYIYWYNDYARWYVGFSDDGQFSFAPSAGYVAFCDGANAQNSPADCDGNWDFIVDDDSDSYVIVTEDRCPSLDCAQIDVDDGTSGGNGGCGVYKDTLFEQTGANVYSTSKLDMEKSLWFDEATWKWRCTDTDAVEKRCGSWSTTDDGLTQSSTYDQLWTDLSAGESFKWTIASVGCPSGTCGTVGNNVTITCYGNGTTTTAPPTATPNPTIADIPTPQPTYNITYPTLTPETTGSVTDNPIDSTPSPSTPTADGSIPAPTAMESETTASEANAGGSGNDLIYWIIIVILAILVLLCCVCIGHHQMSNRKKNRAVSFDHNSQGTRPTANV